jgi:hypothetical protein
MKTGPPDGGSGSRARDSHARRRLDTLLFELKAEKQRDRR